MGKGKMARDEIGEGCSGHITWTLEAKAKNLDFILIVEGSHWQLLSGRVMRSDLCIPYIFDLFT